MVQCSYAGLPPQHATSTPAASPKAAGKAGAWFKKTFAAGKTGGWAGVKQSVTRHSAASSVASDDSETLAGGAVTPAPGGSLFSLCPCGHKLPAASSIVQCCTKHDGSAAAARHTQ